MAQLPAAQDADAHTTEAVEARWWHPAEALEHWDAGDLKLMLPTQTTLREIDEYPDCAAVLAGAEQRHDRSRSTPSCGLRRPASTSCSRPTSA